MLRLTALLCGLMLTANTLHAENWPNWRGPLNNGISTEKNVPLEWSATENVAWKAPLPGPGGINSRRLGRPHLSDINGQFGGRQRCLPDRAQYTRQRTLASQTRQRNQQSTRRRRK